MTTTAKQTTIKSPKDYIGEDQVLTLLELAEVQKAKKLMTVFNAKSNFNQLDALLDGFEAGELIVVSGPAKSGKSLFLQTLTSEFSKQGIITLWFNYEMTLRQFIARFSDKLPDACLPAKMKDNTLLWLEDKILEAIAKYNIKIVCIDHLHFLVDMVRMQSPSLEIGSILRGLKGLAIKHNIVIFLVAHIGKVEDGKRPTAANMRDSSFLTQEPDVVLMVYRLKDQPNKGIVNQAKLSVEMSRRTGVFSKGFRLIKADGMLRELTNVEAHGDEDDK